MAVGGGDGQVGETMHGTKEVSLLPPTRICAAVDCFLPLMG
jgi:hypothetical protein